MPYLHFRFSSSRCRSTSVSRPCNPDHISFFRLFPEAFWHVPQIFERFKNTFYSGCLFNIEFKLFLHMTGFTLQSVNFNLHDPFFYCEFYMYPE